MQTHMHQEGLGSLPSLLPYCLNTHVFQVKENDMVRLLDFERGRFYGLDRMGTSMFTLLLTMGPGETVLRLAREYGVPADRVADDLQTFINTLQAKRVLIPMPQHTQRLHTGGLTLCNTLMHWVYHLSSHFRGLGNMCRRRTALPLHDVPAPLLVLPSRRLVRLLLYCNWISVRLLGWAATVALWQQWQRQHNTERTLDDEFIAALDQRIREEAARTFILPMACKERALTGYQLLCCLYGFPATLIVGTRRYPFEAHAWVQCADRIVTDEAEHCALFTPVARYL